MWCGAGAVSASATAASTSAGSTGSGAEPAHRSAQQLRLASAEFERLLGAQPEQVLLAGPHQVRPFEPSSVHGQSAHHRHRDGGELALDQVGRGGDLVGDGDLGDQQFVAVPVVGAGVAVQHRSPAAPMAASVWPLRQARPIVSVITTPTVTPSELAQAGAQRGGAAVGIDGQQRQFGRADVGAVDAGGGLDQARSRSR